MAAANNAHHLPHCSHRWFHDQNGETNYAKALEGERGGFQFQRGQLWPEDASILLEGGGGTPRGSEQKEPFYMESMRRLGHKNFIPKKQDEDAMGGTVHGWCHIGPAVGVSWATTRQVGFGWLSFVYNPQ